MTYKHYFIVISFIAIFGYITGYLGFWCGVDYDRLAWHYASTACLKKNYPLDINLFHCIAKKSFEEVYK